MRSVYSILVEVIDLCRSYVDFIDNKNIDLITTHLLYRRCNMRTIVNDTTNPDVDIFNRLRGCAARARPTIRAPCRRPCSTNDNTRLTFLTIASGLVAMHGALGDAGLACRLGTEAWSIRNRLPDSDLCND